MKSYGEKTSGLEKVENALRAILVKFDHIVVAIEESKDLLEMKLEELQASLEAHEMRLKQRDSENVSEQKFAHYARVCYYNENNNGNKGVSQFSHEGSNESKDVILMVATHLALEKENVWYLDTGCRNHMTSNKNWFIKFDESIRRSICFADNNMVTSKGICNIRMKKKDGHEATIKDVLYVPSMAGNLVSLGQLLDKNYTMKLEGTKLKVFDEMYRLTLRSPLSTNKTFKVMINMPDHQCLASTTTEDKNWVDIDTSRDCI
ncbi:uncharacterized protein LOC127078813 [Lathyrus oleraceus]|uniref:uncharacterized protein LOC127078813 n=1 Tax=Pisum sativum TaxID=3888 RepID=UPI0021D0C34E|nr:uncharacterized protein LOC127078813 [Pisum sativum]